MSSLIENLKSRAQAKPAPAANATVPRAPVVAAQLAEAERQVGELERQYGSAALDAIADGPGASGRLASLKSNLMEIRERVSTLRAAHAAALERDEALLQSQRAALAQTQLRAVRKHLELRDAAAVALTAAIGEAAKSYHALLDHSRKAQAACPVGMSWPGGSECEPDAIRRYVANEMFRLSASAGDQDGRAFPGSEQPSPEYTWQPEKIPPMAPKIKAASAHVMQRLTGKAPE